MTTNVGVELLTLVSNDPSQPCLLKDGPAAMRLRAAAGTVLPISFFFECCCDEYAPSLKFTGICLCFWCPERTYLTVCAGLGR